MMQSMYDDLYEQLGELETQHRYETLHYGDSWPGAQRDIARLRYELARYERARSASADVPYDDIPY
jgi:hypothetical protein